MEGSGTEGGLACLCVCELGEVPTLWVLCMKCKWRWVGGVYTACSSGQGESDSSFFSNASCFCAGFSAWGAGLVSLLWDQPVLGMSHSLLCGRLSEILVLVTTRGAEAAQPMESHVVQSAS